MSTESAPRDDEIEIQFLASLPPSAGAIAIDGGDREGGRLKLDVPGTELASLLRLTMLRGRVLLVTVAPQQADLPLGPAAPAGEATAFPKASLFEDPIGAQAARTDTVTPGEIQAVVIADIRKGLPKALKPRKVRRGLLPKGRAKAKR